MNKEMALRLLYAGMLAIAIALALTQIPLPHTIDHNLIIPTLWYTAMALVANLMVVTQTSKLRTPLGMMFAVPLALSGVAWASSAILLIGLLLWIFLWRTHWRTGLRAGSILLLANLLAQIVMGRVQNVTLTHLLAYALVLALSAYLLHILWAALTQGLRGKRLLSFPEARSTVLGISLLTAFGALAFFAQSAPFGYFWSIILLAYAFSESRSDAAEESQAQALQHTIDLTAQALNERDSYTEEHSRRVGELAASMAKRMRLGPSEVEDLRKAGILHDLGKMALRDGILSKPGRLTYEEWLDIKEHPQVGAEMLDHHADLHHLATLILHHHERWDGKGYPSGLAREEIPLGARILAVAESFDAMTEKTPYRQTAVTPEEAVREIGLRAHTRYDPRVVDALRLLYPGVVGSRVSMPGAG